MRKVKAQLVRRGTFPQLHTILITYHFLSSHFPGMIKEQSRDAEQNFNCFFFFIFSSPLISFIPPSDCPGGQPPPTTRREAFSLFRQPLRRFLLLRNCRLAGGACRRPYTHNRYCIPPLIRLPWRAATSHYTPGGSTPPGGGSAKKRHPRAESPGGGIGSGGSPYFLILSVVFCFFTPSCVWRPLPGGRFPNRGRRWTG